MTDDVLASQDQIDILVNLAAIYPFATIEEETLAGWQRMLATNLDSAFLCCRSILPHMRRRGYGRVVNTASNTVFNGKPGLGAYVTTKAGLIGLTRVLCREAGPDGVTVNAVSPGLIATQHVLDMFGDGPQAVTAADEFFAVFADAIAQQSVKRRGEPEDIAHAIFFLTEERSSFVSGQTVQVDGGRNFR
jgi:NAD(P)-dependent dehydrogenase (short-subunit alcohol dehydrogenase family)